MEIDLDHPFLLVPITKRLDQNLRRSEQNRTVPKFNTNQI